MSRYACACLASALNCAALAAAPAWRARDSVAATVSFAHASDLLSALQESSCCFSSPLASTSAVWATSVALAALQRAPSTWPDCSTTYFCFASATWQKPSAFSLAWPHASSLALAFSAHSLACFSSSSAFCSTAFCSSVVILAAACAVLQGKA